MELSLIVSDELPIPEDLCEDDETRMRLWSAVCESYAQFGLKIGKVACELEPHWESMSFELRHRGAITHPAFAESAYLGVGLQEKIPCKFTFDNPELLNEEAPWEFGLAAWRMLSELFLAMNISVPGSCSVINLNGFHFRWARRAASDTGWPNIVELDLRTVAEWLRIQNIRSSDSATGPQARSLFSLLGLSRGNQLPHDRALWTAIALESLYRRPLDRDKRLGAASDLCPQLFDRLGHPGKEVAEFVYSEVGSFYETRNKLLHGQGPIFRVNTQANRLPASGPEPFMLALIIATIQLQIQSHSSLLSD